MKCSQIIFVNLMFSKQAAQGNTALKVHRHSDSDYNPGVPFALSNGGVKYSVFSKKIGENKAPLPINPTRPVDRMS